MGQSYLDVCERAGGRCSTEAKAAAIGIRRVLHGEARDFAIEYPCHLPAEQRWFHVTPMREDRRAGAVVMHVNITERKQAENAVRESNEKFHQLADNISDAFWIRSPDLSEVEYVSPAFELESGAAPSKACSHNRKEWVDFILPEDRERVLAAFAGLKGGAKHRR